MSNSGLPLPPGYQSRRNNSFVALLVGSFFARALCAQEYMFTTLAGSGGPGAIDGSAHIARFNNPEGLAIDGGGAIYIADSFNETIRKITPDGVVSTVAGLAPNIGFDDGTGGETRFHSPASLVLDTHQNLFVTDQYNHTIRKITPNGFVTTFAGTAGLSGSSDGTATAARFNFPTGLAIDPAGNLYVADAVNHTIRKITPLQEVTTLAGTAGVIGSGDGTGPSAQFNYPRGVAVGTNGLIYIADSGNQTIRKMTSDGTVTTLAGIAAQIGSADGAPESATFNNPSSITVAASGNLYVADTLNNCVRQVTPDGVVTTFAGDSHPLDPNRPFISYAEGTGATAQFKYPQGIVSDAQGNIFVADSGNNAVRRITSARIVTTVAGGSPTGADDGPGAAARFRHPTGVAAGKGNVADNVFVIDGDNDTVREITRSGLVSTIAGLAGATGSIDGLGAAARFAGPRKMSIDKAGTVFVTDTGNSTLRRLIQIQHAGTNAWQVDTLAGQPGVDGFNDAQGTAALFNTPYDLAVDLVGNLYVADKDNYLIRLMTPDTNVTTFAGSLGSVGAADGPGDQAQFNLPYGIAVDEGGFVYVADTLNDTIRKITPDRAVSTLAGSAGTPGATDGAGGLARFNAPYGLAVDDGGNVFVADYSNNLIRRITPAGVVTTIGGQVESDPDGDPLSGSADGLGAAARFYNPKGIAVDPQGTIYIADSFNNTIRVGTMNYCPDIPTIDQAVARVGERRQLDTFPQTAIAWEWSLIRRPANSHATLSAQNVRNPAFTPDVLDTYQFQLRATNAAGATTVRTLSLTATLPPPSILVSSLTTTNGQFSFAFQGVAGASVQVEVSRDLHTWIRLGTFMNETGSFTIVDSAPDPQSAFYRLRQL